MLIMLYSDTNYVLDGFKAEFSVTNCLNNCSSHGLCQKHHCLCAGDYIGTDCSLKSCDCGDDGSRGFCDGDRCECHSDLSGQSCDLHKNNPDPGQWIWLTNSSNSFSKRTGHIAVYYEPSDSLFVFGGFNLNDVIASLEVFNFTANSWTDGSGKPLKAVQDDKLTDKKALKDLLLDDQSVLDQFWFRAALLSHVETPQPEPTSTKEVDENFQPSPRYGHAACVINDSFIIYGGKLENGSFSDEMWQYNITKREWSLRASRSGITPPKLARHTLTFVTSNRYVYLFGGALENGEFSSQ